MINKMKYSVTNISMAKNNDWIIHFKAFVI